MIQTNNECQNFTFKTCSAFDSLSSQTNITNLLLFIPFCWINHQILHSFVKWAETSHSHTTPRGSVTGTCLLWLCNCQGEVQTTGHLWTLTYFKSSDFIESTGWISDVCTFNWQLELRNNWLLTEQTDFILQHSSPSSRRQQHLQ